MLKKKETNKIKTLKDKFETEFYQKFFSNLTEQLEKLHNAETLEVLLTRTVGILSMYVKISACSIFRIPSLEEITLDNFQYRSANFELRSFLDSSEFLENKQVIFYQDSFSNKLLVLRSKYISTHICFCLQFEEPKIFECKIYPKSQKSFDKIRSDTQKHRDKNQYQVLENFQKSKFLKLFKTCLKILLIEFNSRLEILTLNENSYKFTQDLENIAQTLPIGFLLLDEAGRIKSINKKFEQLFKIQKSQILGNKFKNCFSKSTTIFFTKLLNEHREQKSLEISYEFKNDHGQLLEAKIFRIKNYFLNNEDCYLILFQDLSVNFTLKKYQDSQNLQHEFVTKSIHAVKSPLTSLITGIQLISKSSKSFSAKFNTILNSVEQAAFTTKNLAIDFLEMLKIQSNFDFDIKQNFDTKEILGKIVPKIDFTPLHTLEISVEDVVSNIFMNVQYFEIIVKNLLENAVKYSPKGGLIKVALNQNLSNLVIQISDNGVGMNENELTKIWHLFYRGKSSEVDYRTGVGIGLTIVKLIVSKVNGTINVNSEINKGSKFTVNIPISC